MNFNADIWGEVTSFIYPEGAYEHQQAIHDSPATNLALLGGYGSGKSYCLLIHALLAYVLRFSNCDVLLLRRKFSELDRGLISDLKKLWPPHIAEDLYKYNDSKHIATFFNGSRIFFGCCTNNSERDLDQYLSSSFCFIGIDEAGQFRYESWQALSGRNRINPGCKPDDDGLYPVCKMALATNPFGIGWGWIKKLFVDKRPVSIPEGVKKDKEGRYYTLSNGEWHCIYDPANYFCTQSTVLDNPKFLEKNPEYLTNLQQLPEALKKKRLYGDVNEVSGQYYTNFDPQYHVVNLKKYPDAICWQPWEPKVIGWDFGIGHFSGILFLTRALYKAPLSKNYKPVIVVYREISKNETSSQDLVHAIKNSLQEDEKIQHIFFSHEKFNRTGVSTSHRPSDDVTLQLRLAGLPPVTPASRDRVAGAVYLWNLIEAGDIVFLDSCKGIVAAIPSLQRLESNLEDVMKTNTQADDLFDGLKMALLGMYSGKHKPKSVAQAEKVAKMPDTPYKYQYLAEQTMRKKHENDVIRQPMGQNWMKQFMKG